MEGGDKKSLPMKLYIIICHNAMKCSRSACLFVTQLPATFPRPSAGAFLTCCRREHVCGVPQPHEIELIEPPVLLVRSLHRVSPPLVHNLVSWVAVWKPHREWVKWVKERERGDKSWRQRIWERLMQQCSFYCMHDLDLICINLYSKFSLAMCWWTADQLSNYCLLGICCSAPMVNKYPLSHVIQCVI